MLELHAIRFELFPVLLFWGCWVSLCSPSWQETHYAGAWDYSSALSPKLWDWKCRPLGSTLQSIDLTNKSWTCFFLRFTFWTFVSSCLGWSLRWACVQVKSQYVTELDNLDSETPNSLGQWVLGYQVPVGKLLDFTWAVEVLRPSVRWPIGLIFMYLLSEQVHKDSALWAEWTLKRWASTLRWSRLCRCVYCTFSHGRATFEVCNRSRGKIYRRKFESSHI